MTVPARPSIDQGSDSARLFLALTPGPGLRSAIAQAGDGWKWPAGCSRVQVAQLHLTLHFLGAVPRPRVAEFVRGLGVPLRRFELQLGQPELWPHGLAVLRPWRTPERLTELHAALGSALQRLGWPVEARRFAPHLTLARRAVGAQPPARSPVLHWSVHGYQLVESRGGTYHRLARYH